MWVNKNSAKIIADDILNSKPHVGKNKNIQIKVSDGRYGYDDQLMVSVNSCEFSLFFGKNLDISYTKFSKCLKYNENNRLTLSLYNGFGDNRNFVYNFRCHLNRKHSLRRIYKK